MVMALRLSPSLSSAAPRQGHAPQEACSVGDKGTGEQWVLWKQNVL